MSSTMLFDRSLVSGSSAIQPAGAIGAPATFPSASNLCMVPRCEIKFEKITGGTKICCTCEDETMAATLQNMCRMLCDGLCSCCCLMNGIQTCQCNFAMCSCKCVNSADGVEIHCTSGDKHCASMIQACCDCQHKCMQAGCICCISFGGMPVCCGTCE